MISLTVLGCSGSYPTPGNPCSGYLLEGGGARVWLDAGNGTLAELQRHVAFDQLDAVVLSHAHPDHWADLLSYFVVARYIAPREGIPVYGPTEVRRLATEVHGDLAPVFDWHVTTDGSSASVGGLTFAFSATDHEKDTLASRITDDADAVLGYSADTGPAWSLRALGAGLQLALVEAGVPAEKEGSMQHLSPRQAGRAAADAGAAALLLTHLMPGTEPERAKAEAASQFGGPVEVARPGMTVEVG